jgi:hypothetical protein
MEEEEILMNVLLARILVTSDALSLRQGKMRMGTKRVRLGSRS